MICGHLEEHNRKKQETVGVPTLLNQTPELRTLHKRHINATHGQTQAESSESMQISQMTYHACIQGYTRMHPIIRRRPQSTCNQESSQPPKGVHLINEAPCERSVHRSIRRSIDSTSEPMHMQ